MDGAVPTPSPYAEYSSEALTRCLGQLHGLHNAILRQILAVTAEVERREAYRADGARTPAEWLRAHLGVSAQTSDMLFPWLSLEKVPASTPRSLVDARGPTDLDNLLRFCPAHHRLFHHGGRRLELDERGRWIFIRPDGKIVRDGPPPLDYDVKKWLWDDILVAEPAPTHGPAPPLVAS